MALLTVLLVAVLGWAVWSGKLRAQQLPPILIGVAGAFLAIRGSFLMGVGAVAMAVMWHRGLTHRLFGSRTKQADASAVDHARFLLGVSRFDNAESIKERHRELIAQSHSQEAGRESRAAELNKARDLLLDDLRSKPR
jgi:hypothetical protein